MKKDFNIFWELSLKTQISAITNDINSAFKQPNIEAEIMLLKIKQFKLYIKKFTQVEIKPEMINLNI